MQYYLNDNGSVSINNQKKKKNSKISSESNKNNFSNAVKQYTETVKNSAVKNQGFNLSNAITDLANQRDAKLNILYSLPIVGNPLKTIGKTSLNAVTNMGTGALKAGENTIDTLNDLADAINNPLTYAGNKTVYGKKAADKALKESQENQKQFIKKDLTNEFLNKTGYNNVINDVEKDSLIKRNNFGGQVAQGIGGMVPALVAGEYLGISPDLSSTKGLSGLTKAKVIAGNVGKTYLSQLPSNTLLGLSSYGSGVEEALNSGATREQARKYGLTNAAIEQGTEYLTGGLPGLGGKGGLDDVVEPLIDKTGKGYVNALLKAGYGALGEGLEESTGTYLNALAKKGILGKDINWKDVNKEALQAGLVGAATGAILNSPSSIQDIQNARNEIRNQQAQRVQETPVQQPITQNNINTQQQVETTPTRQENEQIKAQQLNQIDNKQKQLEIINQNNPMQDEYHSGIRSKDDIRTWDEVMNLDDDTEGQFAWGDYSREDALKDKEKGTITIYSSKPIENGNFVSTSKIQAEEYAGGPGNKIYSKEVPLNEVAWINGDEGQYAKVENNNIPVETSKLTQQEQQELETLRNKNAGENPNIPAEMEKEEVLKAIEKNNATSQNDLMKDIRQDVEEQTGKTMSKHIETSSKATGTVQDIKNMNYDTVVYESTTNKKSKEQALRELSGKDTDTNVNDIHSKFRGTERLTDVDSAKITELMKQTLSLADEAAKSGNNAEYNKRMEQFRTLKGDYAVALSESGQFIQYAKVIKELDPETQLDVLNKVIEREQRRGNKKYEGVTLNKDLVEQYKNAKTDAERDVIMEEIKDDTARQIKITFADKANEFRFLSMLGNVKTHGRNIIGNVGMYSLQSFKDGVAAIGEDIYNKTSKNGLETRTKTLKPATKEVSKFVNNKVDEFLKDQTNKYNESRGMKGDLEGRTKKFSDNNIIGKTLNKASDINSKALDFEDKFFSSLMTKQAMKGFLTANGIETNADIEAHPELVAQALDYAIFKGKEATFHQDSTTATSIKNLRDKLYTGSGYSQLGGLAIDATLPFVSTPANIAKTALEYTPIVGFGNMNKQFQNAPDNMKANVVIDSISKQFSGAALIAVGAYLASKGLVKGSGDGDKEDKTEASLGNASYSIKIGNSTYDLSWLSPTAIPFFEGVEIFNALKKAKSKEGLKATDTADLIDTLFGTLNPMTDMSVLQSIERIITSIAYGGNAVKSATSSTFSSYLQQYIPTLLSQFAQIGDTKQRNTNTGSNVLEKTYDQIKYKIPGARNTLPERVDVWGDTNKTASNLGQRAFEALLSPANRKDYKVDKTTKELERLANATDDTAMLPTIKKKNVTINQKDYELKGKDYVNLQKTYGKTAKNNLDKLTKSQAYKNANDAEKRKMVGNLYDYASYKSKEQYAKNKGINFDGGYQTSYAMIDAFNIPYEKYVENKVSGNESASTMLNKLNNAGFSEMQKGAIMNYFNRAYYVDENELYNTLNYSNLSNKQKELVKSKYEKNITEKDREKYKRANDIGIDYGLYTEFRSFVSSAKGDSRSGGPTKNQKIINWIQNQKLTAQQKRKLYNDYKNNQGILSYYK